VLATYQLEGCEQGPLGLLIRCPSARTVAEVVSDQLGAGSSKPSERKKREGPPAAKLQGTLSPYLVIS
jgi:hypothetical protein